jgi:hypothetical protein
VALVKEKWRRRGRGGRLSEPGRRSAQFTAQATQSLAEHVADAADHLGRHVADFVDVGGRIHGFRAALRCRHFGTGTILVIAARLGVTARHKKKVSVGQALNSDASA